MSVSASHHLLFKYTLVSRSAYCIEFSGIIHMHSVIQFNVCSVVTFFGRKQEGEIKLLVYNIQKYSD